MIAWSSARDAAATLGRPVSFATDMPSTGDARLASADIGHGEPILPAFAEVVDLIDNGLSLSTSRRRGLPAAIQRSVPSWSLIGKPYLCLPVVELPEMVIEPSHD